ncbi:copper resistance protein CopC [Cellulomonas sp. 179-A 4D5 NHS]|uniref:copper resistance CopC family protein n=1 Tax=Cellulomonas sp. 179-A 4D5 NHS TaxID=3142378 RepID=UPI00399FAAE2
MAVLVGLGLALLGAGPAAAHNTLVSSDPADGSTAATAPAQVTLTFNEPAVALGTVVEVRAPDGRVVSSGEAVLTDASVAQGLSGELPAGDYSVLWRVTSADGHPIEGQLTFTAQGPTTVGDEPAAADPAATPTAETPTATPTTTPTAPEATESAEPAERDPAAEASATNVLLAGTVAALAALGVVVAVLIRRRPLSHHGGAGGPAVAGAPRAGEPDGPTGGSGGAGPDGSDGSTGTRDGSTGG